MIAIVLPTGSFSFILAYFSKNLSIINNYGYIGWIFVGIFTFLIMSISIFISVFSYKNILHIQFSRKFLYNSDNINPLHHQFDMKRISVTTIAHPMEGTIKNKTFTKCELIGPANILLTGGGILTGTSFFNCDLVVLNDSSEIFNAYLMQNCSIIDCSIYKCTLMLYKSDYEKVKNGIPPKMVINLA
ncbi:hypothetical protein NON00_14720 [Roseomonas sp. GC11]|uniref:hypothetical protein n=1 Tax=Roseomonas sp. GC11 TaxID=2950546 RepID=UPI00210EA687|nr:hypothetical protein [Roseomonas sp. GC11]MCQ4161176.1 hypothetical protein [Roseomonas sp. GC11]